MDIPAEERKFLEYNDGMTTNSHEETTTSSPGKVARIVSWPCVDFFPLLIVLVVGVGMWRHSSILLLDYVIWALSLSSQSFIINFPTYI